MSSKLTLYGNVPTPFKKIYRLSYNRHQKQLLLCGFGRCIANIKWSWAHIIRNSEQSEQSAIALWTLKCFHCSYSVDRSQDWDVLVGTGDLRCFLMRKTWQINNARGIPRVLVRLKLFPYKLYTFSKFIFTESKMYLFFCPAVTLEIYIIEMCDIR